MSVRFELCDAHTVQRYAEALLDLERAITYPLGDGRERFFIDHGEDYHRFFSTMGDAYFLVALDGSNVVGVVVGVLKRAVHEGRAWQSAYVCDLKLAPSHRGSGVAAALLREALSISARRSALRRWRFAYGAAMRGERGDVMRSASGPLHPATLAGPWATLRLWFVEPSRLASLDPRACPSNPESLFDLSPAARLHGAIDGELGLVSTAGRKDLRLVSSGAPWPLVHVATSPSSYRSTLGEHLRAVGRALVARDENALVCWAIDDRLRAHWSWLEGRGLRSDTVCTVYGLSLPTGPSREPLVHLSTSEI
ncbi:MAG: GNAT family N-acetyltransferase [Polyangiales bacterium]